MPAAKEKTKSRFAKKRLESPAPPPPLVVCGPAVRVLGHRSMQKLKNLTRKQL